MGSSARWRVRCGESVDECIDPRHGRDRLLVEGIHDGGEVAGVDDQHLLGAEEHHRHAVASEGENVVERQRAEHREVLFRAEFGRHPRVYLECVGDQIPIRQHRAFAHAGRSAGVLQHDRIAAAALVKLQLKFLATLQCRFKYDRVRETVARDELFDVAHGEIDQLPFQAQ